MKVIQGQRGEDGGQRFIQGVARMAARNWYLAFWQCSGSQCKLTALTLIVFVIKHVLQLILYNCSSSHCSYVSRFLGIHGFGFMASSSMSNILHCVHYSSLSCYLEPLRFSLRFFLWRFFKKKKKNVFPHPVWGFLSNGCCICRECKALWGERFSWAVQIPNVGIWIQCEDVAAGQPSCVRTD